MSILRVGVGENKKYAEGYDAIFGKKKAKADKSGSEGKEKRITKGRKSKSTKRK